MSNESDAKGLRELAGFVQMSDVQREALERIANRLESDAKRDAQYDALQDIGKSAFESIAEMVAALECDYDRLEELREHRKDWFAENPGKFIGIRANTRNNYALACPDEAEELAELIEAAGECESRDDAETRIQQDALSVELAGTWTLGERPVADKAYILLGTGGPAMRIVCELSDGEPHRAWIQAHDWGTPWTDYIGGDSETLLTYCRCFYFGEG